MTLKTTLNQLQDFFSNIIQKTILFSSTLFEKKVWLFPFDIPQTLIFVFNSAKSYKKSVFDILQTDKNREIKGAPPEEVYYILYIPIY